MGNINRKIVAFVLLGVLLGVAFGSLFGWAWGTMPADILVGTVVFSLWGSYLGVVLIILMSHSRGRQEEPVAPEEG